MEILICPESVKTTKKVKIDTSVIQHVLNWFAMNRGNKL